MLGSLFIPGIVSYIMAAGNFTEAMRSDMFEVFSNAVLVFVVACVVFLFFLSVAAGSLWDKLNK